MLGRVCRKDQKPIHLVAFDKKLNIFSIPSHKPSISNDIEENETNCLMTKANMKLKNADNCDAKTHPKSKSMAFENYVDLLKSKSNIDIFYKTDRNTNEKVLTPPKKNESTAQMTKFSRSNTATKLRTKSQIDMNKILNQTVFDKSAKKINEPNLNKSILKDEKKMNQGEDKITRLNVKSMEKSHSTKKIFFKTPEKKPISRTSLNLNTSIQNKSFSNPEKNPQKALKPKEFSNKPSRNSPTGANSNIQNQKQTIYSARQRINSAQKLQNIVQASNPNNSSNKLCSDNSPPLCFAMHNNDKNSPKKNQETLKHHCNSNSIHEFNAKVENLENKLNFLLKNEKLESNQPQKLNENQLPLRLLTNNIESHDIILNDGQLSFRNHLHFVRDDDSIQEHSFNFGYYQIGNKALPLELTKSSLDHKENETYKDHSTIIDENGKWIGRNIVNNQSYKRTQLHDESISRFPPQYSLNLLSPCNRKQQFQESKNNFSFQNSNHSNNISILSQSSNDESYPEIPEKSFTTNQFGHITLVKQSSVAGNISNSNITWNPEKSIQDKLYNYILDNFQDKENNLDYWHNI